MAIDDIDVVAVNAGNYHQLPGHETLGPSDGKQRLFKAMFMGSPRA
jgi:hypothetical protein